MQVDWYRTRVPGNASLEALIQARGGSLVPSPPGAATGGSSDAPSVGTNGTDSPPCVLWGVPDEDPANYMAMQCVYPYQGRLCATCAPGHALSADFECLE